MFIILCWAARSGKPTARLQRTPPWLAIEAKPKSNLRRTGRENHQQNIRFSDKTLRTQQTTICSNHLKTGTGDVAPTTPGTNTTCFHNSWVSSPNTETPGDSQSSVLAEKISVFRFAVRRNTVRHALEDTGNCVLCKPRPVTETNVPQEQQCSCFDHFAKTCWMISNTLSFAHFPGHPVAVSSRIYVFSRCHQNGISNKIKLEGEDGFGKTANLSQINLSWSPRFPPVKHTFWTVPLTFPRANLCIVPAFQTGATCAEQETQKHQSCRSCHPTRRRHLPMRPTLQRHRNL